MHNEITMNMQTGLGTYFGSVASPYAYKPELRAALDRLWIAAQNSENRYFVLDGAVTSAAQTTEAGALRYLLPGYVLVRFVA